MIREPEARRPFVVNPGKPIVRTTFRLSAVVGRIGKKSPDLDSVIQTAVEWVEQKHHEKLPKEARSGQSFEIDQAGSQIAAIRFQDEWALRLRQPDAPSPYGDRPAVPGRIWTTELSIRKIGKGVVFGCWVTCSSQPYENPPITFTRPRVCVDIAKKYGLIDDLELSDEPMWISSNADLDLLEKFLLTTERKKPVVVISEIEEDQLEFDGSSYPINVDELAKRLLCLAHVVGLPKEFAKLWSDRVGKEWAVFRGGIRNYQPNLDPETQGPYEHPLAIYAKVQNWTWQGKRGPDAFGRFLGERCIEDSLGQTTATTETSFYSDLRARNAEHEANSRRGNQIEVEKALRVQLKALQEKVDEYAAIAEQAMDDEKWVKGENERLRDENHHLRRTNDNLREIFRRSGTFEIPTSIRPGHYDELSEWCKTELTGRVVLHPRAVRSLKGARYRDLDLVLDTLELLGNEYRDFCMGKDQGKSVFEEKCKTLSLRYSQSISDSRLGEKREKYEVIYPVGSSQKRILEWHLGKGTSRLEEECLRVYFFFDADTEQVIVGWLPSHLDTRAS